MRDVQQAESKAAAEGVCRQCARHLPRAVLLTTARFDVDGVVRPELSVPLCARCEDEWRGGRSHLLGATTRVEQAALVACLGLVAALRHLGDDPRVGRVVVPFRSGCDGSGSGVTCGGLTDPHQEVPVPKPKPKPGEAELPRVYVDEAIAEGFRAMSERTGAPVTWHRRQAYVAYLMANGELDEPVQRAS